MSSGPQKSAAGSSTSWPKWLCRGPMENLATLLIAIGFLMMFQPFVKVLYTYSFITILAGTVMFIVVSKFPEANDG